jgi:hypothetical protein
MKFRLPEIVLGSFLTVAVFAVGMLFASSYQPSPAAKNQSQQSEPAGQNRAGPATSHANDGQAAQHKEEKNEFWSAKLTDWLLAVFTFFLVAFTGALVRSTNRLWKAALDQARVSENAFAQLEGPVIEANRITLDVIQGPAGPGDPAPTVKFWLKNRGRGPGFIVRAFGRLIALPHGVKIPLAPQYGKPQLSNMALAAGEETPDSLDFVLEAPNGAPEPELALVFYGYVEYRGVFGGVSTWAWGLSPSKSGRFNVVGGTAYNYRKYEPDRKT